MSVDPHNDYHAHDPQDGQPRSEDPKIRETEELEARMRRALATKEDPLRDDESTSERLRRLEADPSESPASQESSEASDPSDPSEPSVSPGEEHSSS